MQIYFYKNDMLLELTGLRDETTMAYVNNATVTATVKDKNGVEVAGETWPITMGYVALSNGNYQGVLESDLTVSVGDYIMVEVTITASGDREAFFAVPTVVRRRGQVYE